MMGVEDVVEILSCDLIGVIPEDTNIITSTNKGEPVVNDEKSLAGMAYLNVAKRIMGEEVEETGDFIVDEKDKRVNLTDQGIDKVEKRMEH